MTEAEIIINTNNIDEVMANEASHMAERDFVLDVVPDFVKAYDRDGNPIEGASRVAVQTLVAIREGKDHAPESNGLPVGNLMLDFLVEEKAIVGKRVAFKAPLFTLGHVADSINEAIAVYDEQNNPKKANARRKVTDKLGIPERVARLMTDDEVIQMSVRHLFKL